MGLVALVICTIAAVVRFWRKASLKSLRNWLGVVSYAWLVEACIQPGENTPENDLSDSQSGHSAIAEAAPTTTTSASLTASTITPSSTPPSSSQAWDTLYVKTMHRPTTYYTEESTTSGMFLFRHFYTLVH